MATSILSILLFSIIFNGVMGDLAPTNLLATRIGPCYANPSKEVTVSEMSLNTRLYDSSLSGMMNITNDVENGWVVKGTMQKCQDIRNLDTCDYFKTFTIISNGCDEEEENEEQEIYSMFFHHVHPRITCPIKAGIYKIVNYPIFTEDNYLIVAESKISTSVFGYTMRMEGYADTTRILCVEAYLQLLYIREYEERDDSSQKPTAEPSSEEERVASEEEEGE
ncbi:uncharacterized protein LOC128675982 [Plodia interpunctella]|uniref:uncharacterized protein LOC128675982 n=1 Tax=Plodia interpunctella TaxID=58824 RepID=UPI0023678B8A|nr:uncharacterized protein LOC128675982 [Plodia interpunctella]